MHMASRALAAGADFTLLGPKRTMLHSSLPVIAITAVRTGCGKSAIARWLSHRLRQRGLRVAVMRHPMPYGDLAKQRAGLVNMEKASADRHDLKITRLHSHIGSGTDPEVWKRAIRMTLDLAAKLPDVRTVNLGGGFKVGRMPGEKSADMADVGARVKQELLGFRERDGRSIHLEIEPGTFLVASGGMVVATCVDVVDTGREGYLFAKLDTGMTEVTRPSLYGAQHPIEVLAEGRDEADVIFAGPCCESGDILTPAPGDPEALAPRRVRRPSIGDLVVVGGAGAYCAAMSTINYNSYPQAPEVMLEPDGTLRLLRRRQAPEQVWANEV